MDTFELAREILRDNLQLGDRANSITRDTALMGALPEFSSLTVVGLITSVEEQLGCSVDDDEIVADVFETAGSFADFIAYKMT
jgi:acyl carrier protein